MPYQEGRISRVERNYKWVENIHKVKGNIKKEGVAVFKVQMSQSP